MLEMSLSQSPVPASPQPEASHPLPQPACRTVAGRPQSFVIDVLPAGLQIEAEVVAATSEVLIYCGYTTNELDSPDNPLDQKLPGGKGHIGRPAHARTWIVFPADIVPAFHPNQCQSSSDGRPPLPWLASYCPADLDPPG